jgi:hypothetical protein
VGEVARGAVTTEESSEWVKGGVLEVLEYREEGVWEGVVKSDQ